MKKKFGMFIKMLAFCFLSCGISRVWVHVCGLGNHLIKLSEVCGFALADLKNTWIFGLTVAD